MKSVRKIIGVVVLIFAIISSLLLVIASYVQYLSPAVMALPALLGLAFPIVLCVTLFFFVLLLIIYPLYALAPLAALLLSIPAALQYCPINGKSIKINTNRDTFTLLSYNVYHYVDIGVEPYEGELQYNRTLQYILDINADIVALQEVSSVKYPSKRLNTTQEQIDKLNELYPYRIYQNRNQVLSKYPIELVMDTMYTKTAFTSVYKVDINDRTLTLFNNHLESIGLNKDDKQLYKDITNGVDSIGAKVGGIKAFTRKFLTAFENRAHQVDCIDSLARQMGGDIIMCGDINDTPNSYAYYRLKKGREDAFLEKGSGPGYTYKANRMWVRIDHIIYDGELEASYIEKGKKQYSDHYPILVEFEWR